jgi:hypothetical protein
MLEKFGFADMKPSSLPLPVAHDLKRRKIGEERAPLKEREKRSSHT